MAANKSIYNRYVVYVDYVPTAFFDDAVDFAVETEISVDSEVIAYIQSVPATN